MRNKKLLYGSLIGILVILISAIAIFSFNEMNRGITQNVNEMLEKAKYFYENGKIDDAYYQLQLYCDEKPDNYDGYLLLGDYSMELGKADKAYSYYKTASENYKPADNELSEGNKIKVINAKSNKLSLKISPTTRLTKNMTFTVSGENLTPEKTFSGKINGSGEKLVENENCTTTDWFNIDYNQKYILLTGDISCAIWQFADKNNSITGYNDKSDFRKVTNVRFANKSYSSVEIPKGSVKARVTYKNNEKNDILKSDDKIFISYGAFLSGYTDVNSVTYKIPDMSEGQYVIYKDGKWSFFNGKEEEPLDWQKIDAPRNAFYSIDGDLCGVVEFTTQKVSDKVDKNLEYGIKYSRKSGVAACERLGASKGMKFNYTVEDNWVENGGNDFDNAYPWSDIKLCNVKYNSNGEKKVTYSDNKKFKKDGSNGNVMVEIPKFYIKRNVKNNYEEIWISGKKHKGYQIDPIFVGENGEELDSVYVAAYLGAEKGDKIVSVANSYPTLMLTYGETMEKAENNGGGYSEMNYLMCSALQKLFIVETGTIDSSSVFAGDTFMYYYYDTDKTENSGLAYKDAENSNKITLYNNYGTQKITVGSSIAIFSGWDDYDNNQTPKREVVAVHQTKEYIEVEFDGEPLNIKKNKTNISNIPQLTGKTDKIKYCTGTLKGEDGKVSFKYRNIENIYGSALVMLDDDAYVEDGYFYYYDGMGLLNRVEDKVASQPKDLSNYSDVNQKCCITRMTFDSDNPSIMLPSKVGGGSSSHNYYGDFWMYKNDNDGTKKYFLYGGADDNSRLAGIFQMRAAMLSENFAYSFYSARIMCK